MKNKQKMNNEPGQWSKELFTEKIHTFSQPASDFLLQNPLTKSE